MRVNKKIIIGLFCLLLLWPILSLAQGCEPGAAATNQLCNPFARAIQNFVPGINLGGANDLPTLFLRLLTIFTTFATIIPIVIVMAAGFQMIIAQGNAEDVKRAKTAFSYAVYGFVVAVLSFVIVAGMANFLGATQIPDPSNPAANTRVVNPIAEPDFGGFLFNRLIKGFLEVVGVLAILMLVFNGFRYITAGGDEEQVSEAKAAMKWITSGIIAILFAYVIIRATATLLGLPGS